VCSPFRALSMTYQATMSASARAGMFLAWNFLVYIMGSGAHKEVACSILIVLVCPTKEPAHCGKVCRLGHVPCCKVKQAHCPPRAPLRRYFPHPETPVQPQRQSRCAALGRGRPAGRRAKAVCMSYPREEQRGTWQPVSAPEDASAALQP
jgi:hypothetical protein